MNFNELYIALMGGHGPFQQILKKLDKLEKDHDQIKSELGQIEIGETQWQHNVIDRLQAIKDQLDRIEDAVTGTQAATLIVTVGEPYEQE